MNMQDRLSGCFWGLVVGDALGAPIEFYPRDRHPEVRDMISGGKFNLPAVVGRMIRPWLAVWHTV